MSLGRSGRSLTPLSLSCFLSGLFCTLYSLYSFSRYIRNSHRFLPLSCFDSVSRPRLSEASARECSRERLAEKADRESPQLSSLEKPGFGSVHHVNV